MQIQIKGSLDLSAYKQHIPHTFTMPPHATRLHIAMTYKDRVKVETEYGNQISLSLFDPQGARGARHNNDDQTLTITAHSSTPGYVSGELQDGTWMVWIDVHRMVAPLDYTITIEISDEPLAETAIVFQKGTVAPRGRGWYRGDLHAHTIHSDGGWDVPDLVNWARQNRLDFVTLTDHNTVSPLAQHDSLATDKLLTMGGIELTGYSGHALAIGTRTWMEWRAGLNEWTMQVLAQRVMDAGALFIIAHPMSVGNPSCTGCDWAHDDMMPGNARIVEIWNYVWELDSNNEQGVQLWYRWLNEGYRMVATRGSDIHVPLPENIGFNVVYADELSETAIVDAIRRGHLYLSAGPALELTAAGSDGALAMMGDLIDGDDISARLTWRDSQQGDVLRIVVNGDIVETLPCESEGMVERSLHRPDARWCVIEIRGANGHMRAITNPIFLGSEADWR